MALLETAQTLRGGDSGPDIGSIEAEQRALAAAINKPLDGETPPQPMRESDPEKIVTPDKLYKATIEQEIDEPFDFGEFAKHTNKADKGQLVTETKIVAVPPKQVDPPKQADPRDVSDLSEELQPLFKQMSNDSFNTLKPILKKNKEEISALQTQLAEAKKGGLPENYYEHEMGYVLSPEFSQKSQSAELAGSVLAHWRSQLTDVRGGAETYIPLIQDAQGIITQGTPIKVDRGTDVQLAEIHAWAQQQSLNEQAELRALATIHKEKSGQVKNWISNFQSKAFPVFDKEPTLKAMVDDTVKNFPPALHSNPLTPVLARAFVALAQLGERLKGTTSVAPVTPKKQPSAAEIAGGSASKVDEDNTFELFQKARKGLL